MSYANEKGGYQKSLEISRENSNRSITNLHADFLQKAENYLLNVTDFVTNTSPPMNLLSGAYFRILPLGDQNESLLVAGVAAQAYEREVDFEPTVYRTWLELARQLEAFFQTLTADYNAAVVIQEPQYAEFYMTQDGKFSLQLSAAFLSRRYIVFSSDLQKILDCPPYVFKVRETADAGAIHRTHNTRNADGGAYSLFLANGTFGFNFRTHGSGETFNYQAPRPLINFEQRESIDVYSTFPMKSRITTNSGKEEHEHILFRLPYAEQHSFVCSSTFQTSNMGSNLANISENIDVGLTNLCDKHSNTLHQTLLSGRIRNVILRVAVRYMTLDGIVERDMDFKNGFWYLRLLFVKKV